LVPFGFFFWFTNFAKTQFGAGGCGAALLRLLISRRDIAASSEGPTATWRAGTHAAARFDEAAEIQPMPRTKAELGTAIPDCPRCPSPVRASAFSALFATRYDAARRFKCAAGANRVWGDTGGENRFYLIVAMSFFNRLWNSAIVAKANLP
jgi:hypothetical protein